jgi:hypothetical protein
VRGIELGIKKRRSRIVVHVWSFSPLLVVAAHCGRRVPGASPSF